MLNRSQRQMVRRIKRMFEEALEPVIELLEKDKQRDDIMQTKIDELKAVTTATRGEMASVKVYVKGLLDAVEGAKDDPEELEAILVDARATLGDLTNMIKANPGPSDPPADPPAL